TPIRGRNPNLSGRPVGAVLRAQVLLPDRARRPATARGPPLAGGEPPQRPDCPGPADRGLAPTADLPGQGAHLSHAAAREPRSRTGSAPGGARPRRSEGHARESRVARRRCTRGGLGPGGGALPGGPEPLRTV